LILIYLAFRYSNFRNLLWNANIAKELGGEVVTSDIREFGHASISLANNSMLFEGVNLNEGLLDVWMSHGDKVTVLP